MSPLRIALLGGAAALSLSLGAAFAAAAETAPKAPTEQRVEKRVVIINDGSPGGEHVMRWESHGDGHNPEHMAKQLRDVLQLTPAQEPALQAFLASMKPSERPGHEERRIEIRREHGATPGDMAMVKEEMAKAHAEMSKHHEEMEKRHAEEAAMTTPQRLDLMVKHMSEHMAEAQSHMQQHVDAVKRFYAALSPSQQKAFDAMHEGMMGGMHGMGDGMHIEMRDHMGMMAPMAPLPPLPPMAMRAPRPPAPPAPPAPPPPPAF